MKHDVYYVVESEYGQLIDKNHGDFYYTGGIKFKSYDEAHELAKKFNASVVEYEVFKTWLGK